MFDPHYPEAICVQGNYRLSGSVDVPGDKVTAVHLILATLMCDEETRIKNMHFCGDVIRILKWIEFKKCAKCEFVNGILRIKPDRNKLKDGVDLTRLVATRTNICLIIPSVQKYGRAIFKGVKGCNFADRKTDLHFDLIKAFGIDVSVSGDYYIFTKKRSPKRVQFDCATKKYGPSVGVTCHALIASMVSDFDIELRNAAQEPVVRTLIEYAKAGFNKKIEVKDRNIKIYSLKSVKNKRAIISLPADLTVAFAFISAVMVNGGNISIRGIGDLPVSIKSVLRRMRVDFTADSGMIKLSCENVVHPRKVICEPWPGFPTDIGPILTAALVKHKGTTRIVDMVYDSRSTHVNALNKMGYKLKTEGNVVVITGCSEHSDCEVEVKAPDIRSGAAILIAALARPAETLITNYWQIYRGYSDLVGQLNNLGANIKIVKTARYKL